MRSFNNEGNFTEMQAHIVENSVLHIIGDLHRSRLIIGQ